MSFGLRRIVLFLESYLKQTNLSWPSLLSHSLDLVQYSVGTPANVFFCENINILIL